MTCLIETPVFVWRGWSNPNFRLQGSEVTICVLCTLKFEVLVFRWKHVLTIRCVIELFVILSTLIQKHWCRIYEIILFIHNVLIP